MGQLTLWSQGRVCRILISNKKCSMPCHDVCNEMNVNICRCYIHIYIHIDLLFRNKGMKLCAGGSYPKDIETGGGGDSHISAREG